MKTEGEGTSSLVDKPVTYSSQPGNFMYQNRLVKKQKIYLKCILSLMPNALQGSFSSWNYLETHYKYSASDMSADKLIKSNR